MVDNITNNTVSTQKVIDAYADGLDGFTVEEAYDLGFDTQDWVILSGVISKDKGGVVTDEEKTLLFNHGFSHDFVDTLSGTDGKKALQSRVRWLSDHCLQNLFRTRSLDDRKKMIEELGEIGPDAEGAVAKLAQAAKRGTDTYFKALTALKHLGQAAKPALPIIAENIKAELKFDFVWDSVDELAENIRVLKAIGQDSVPLLLELLEIETPSYKRRWLLWGLSEIIPKIPEAVLPIIQASYWDAPAGPNSKFATLSLKRMGKIAINEMLRMLKNNRAEVRVAAIDGLEMVGAKGDDIVAALITRLYDEKMDELRCHFALVLGNMGESALLAAPDLEDMAVKDPYSVCRVNAKYAYEKILNETW